MHIKKQTILFALVSMIFFVFMWSLNSLTTWGSDDVFYGCVFKNAHLQKLQDLSVAWFANIADGYRPIVHLLARIFCGCLDKWLFNVLNAGVAFLLVMGMLRFACNTWQIIPIERLLLTILLFVVAIFSGDTCLWVTGSCNYLWTSVGTLGFVIMLQKYQGNMGETGLGIISTIVFAVYAFMVGWMNESFSLPICFGLVVVFMARGYRGLKTLVPQVMFMIGALLLVLGSIDRASSEGGALSCMFVVKSFVKFFLYAWGVDIVIFLFLLHRSKKDFVKRNLFALACIVGSFLLHLLVGTHGFRMAFCANMFSSMIVIRELPVVKIKGLLISCLILCLGVFFLNVKSYQQVSRYVKMYQGSEDGITVRDAIPLYLNRFCYQSVPAWQIGFHRRFFASFYGHKNNAYPCGVQRELYESLYLTNKLCRAENRLNIKGMDAYSKDYLNAIIIPVKKGDGTNWDNLECNVAYRKPRNLYGSILRKIRQYNGHAIGMEWHPMKFYTHHGIFLLIPKFMGWDSDIESIKFSTLSLENRKLMDKNQ